MLLQGTKQVQQSFSTDCSQKIANDMIPSGSNRTASFARFSRFYKEGALPGITVGHMHKSQEGGGCTIRLNKIFTKVSPDFTMVLPMFYLNRNWQFFTRHPVAIGCWCRSFSLCPSLGPWPWLFSRPPARPETWEMTQVLSPRKMLQNLVHRNYK